ncbi:MAG: hypothetical protein ACE5FP_11430 [Gemmatimonadota bacterium]
MNDERLESSSEQPPGMGEHPKGTLAIVGLYGLLFTLGWFILYFFVFLPRGAPTQ